jgi:hypothetical protein
LRRFDLARVSQAPGEQRDGPRRESRTSDEHRAWLVPALPTRKQCTLEKEASLLVAPSAANEVSLPHRSPLVGGGDIPPGGAKPHREFPRRCAAKRRPA